MKSFCAELLFFNEVIVASLSCAFIAVLEGLVSNCIMIFITTLAFFFGRLYFVICIKYKS